MALLRGSPSRPRPAGGARVGGRRAVGRFSVFSGVVRDARRELPAYRAAVGVFYAMRVWRAVATFDSVVCRLSLAEAETA